MKGKKHTPQQMIFGLRDTDADLAAGFSVHGIASKLQINEATCRRWHWPYGGMKGEEIKKLKELEEENLCRKLLIGELELGKRVLREGLQGKD